MDFKSIVIIFLGGGLGSSLRFIISKLLYPIFSSPISGTLTVNLLGSLLIGLFVGFEIKNIVEKPILLFFTTGFCGGFTTFSAFVFENNNLLKSGDYIQSFLYIISSIILGLISVAIGFMIAKLF